MKWRTRANTSGETRFFSERPDPSRIENWVESIFIERNL